MLRLRTTAVLCAVILITAITSYAQGPNATISGVVHDQTGAVLPGVSIQVINRETGVVRNVISDDEGRYRVPALEAGTYAIEGSLTGFRTVVREGVVLTVGSQAVVDLTTEVGQLSENLTVTGDVPLVQTTSAELSGLVGDQEIRDLPLNGRSYEALAFLQPGVSQFTSSSTGTTAIVANGSGAKMSVAATPGDFQSFLLDGTDIHDHAGFTPGSVARNNLGVDAIREFRVLTQNYSAEYGRTAGGVISAVTRAGTNGYHGSVFEFFRDNALDAREFFDQGGTKPFRRNQFGAAVGGPIRRDKTFFFGNYEGLRENRTQTLLRTVPTEAARRGALPGRTVTVSSLIQPYLDLIPLPNGRDFGDGTAEYVWEAPTDTHEDFASFRLDHQLSTNQSLFGRFMLDDADSTQPNTLPPFLSAVTSRNTFITLEHKYILSPTVLNVMRGAFNRTNPLLKDQVDLPGDEARRFVAGRTWSINSQVSAFSDIGHLNSAPQQFAQNIYQFTDDLDMQRGPHAIRMGFNFERIQNNNETQTSQAQYQFTDLASLLQARPARFVALTLDSGTTARFRQSFIGYYFQDDWKVSKALTLNLGLRHEFVTIPTEVSGSQANIRNVFTDTAPTFGAVFTKNPSLGNVAPRFGFAWVPFGEHRPVIRGGAGIYYNEIMGRLYYQYARSGFLKTAQINNPSFPNPGLASVTAGNVSYSIWDPQPKTPTVYQYNLTVEQQLAWNTVVTVSYAGSQGRHWVRDRSPNTRAPQFLANGTPFYPSANAPRINSAFGNIRQIVTDANSNYNALQLQATRRQSERLVWQTSYTYSSAISSATAWGAAHTQNTSDISVVPWDANADRGLSSFHIRHMVAVNATYRLPGDSLTGAAGILARGWETSMIVSAHSGTPFSAQLGFNRSNDGNSDAPERPNLRAGASNNPIIGTVERWYDPTAFVLPAAGTYGNLGRNTLIGPNLVNVNMSIVKTFRPHEGQTLAFRSEFFNLFNHANFGLPNRFPLLADGTYSGSAGVIQSLATSSRQIQFGLRYSF
jgi:Carboxypeptidase regulatory-like domain/TonB-dependent Receptor Plug Domain